MQWKYWTDALTDTVRNHDLAGTGRLALAPSDNGHILLFSQQARKVMERYIQDHAHEIQGNAAAESLFPALARRARHVVFEIQPNGQGGHQWVTWGYTPSGSELRTLARANQQLQTGDDVYVGARGRLLQAGWFVAETAAGFGEAGGELLQRSFQGGKMLATDPLGTAKNVRDNTGKIIKEVARDPNRALDKMLEGAVGQFMGLSDPHQLGKFLFEQVLGAMTGAAASKLAGSALSGRQVHCLWFSRNDRRCHKGTICLRHIGEYPMAAPVSQQSLHVPVCPSHHPSSQCGLRMICVATRHLRPAYRRKRVWSGGAVVSWS